MTPYDDMSDEEILKAAGLPVPASAAQPSAPTMSHYDHISDEDVLKAAGITKSDTVPTPTGPPQMGGVLREPALIGSNVVKGAAESIPSTVDFLFGEKPRNPADPEAYARAKQDNLVNVARGLDDPKTDEQIAAEVQGSRAKSMPMTKALDSGLTATGLANRPDLQPQGAGEEYLAAASQGAGAALPFALTGGAPAAAMNLARGAASGAGAQLGHDIAPDSEVAPLLGGLAGGMVPGALKGVAIGGASLGRNALGAYDPSERANAIIAKKLTADKVNPAEITQTLADNPDKPLTLADLAGPATQRMARASLDVPSEGSAAATQMLQDRDLGAGVNGPHDMFKQGGTADRIVDNIKSALGSDDAFKTTEQLLAQRKADSGPAYDKAFQGGSTAPLEKQFQGYFADASAAESAAQKAVSQAQQKITNAAGRQQTTGNVYGAANANGQASTASSELNAAQNALGVAQNNKAAILARLRQAQADGTANAPGAVWSPRIQQFLNDPIMKGGIGRGLQIQRIESVAEGKPFDPSEYAVTGTDDAGNPIVGSVPNMRLLDAGKRGLDAIIQDNQDAVTGKLNEYGRAVDMFRRSYLGQLDNLNPDYKTARMAYSGPTKSIQAIEQGQKVFNTAPEKVASTLQGLEPEDQALFRIGVQKALISRVQNTADGANEVKQLFGNPAKRASIAAAFDNPDALKQLSQNLGMENRMFETKGLLGGARTAPSLLDQADMAIPGLGHVGEAAAHAAGGNHAGALMRLAAPLVNRIREGANTDTTSLLAQRLLNSDPQQNAATMALVQALMGQAPKQPSLFAPSNGLLAGPLMQPTGQ